MIPLTTIQTLRRRWPYKYLPMRESAAYCCVAVGVGAAIAANKVPGARASLCHDTYSARQGVEHDDMNILCLGTRVIGVDLAKELVAAFLDARFSGEERHRRRLQKVRDIEHRAFQRNV